MKTFKTFKRKAFVFALSISLAGNCLYPTEMALAETAEPTESSSSDSEISDVILAGTFTEADSFDKEDYVKAPIKVDVGKNYVFDLSGVDGVGENITWEMKSDGDYNGKDETHTLVDWADSDETATKRTIQVKAYETPLWYQSDGIITIVATTEEGTEFRWKLSINMIITRATKMELIEQDVTVAKNKKRSVGIQLTSETEGKTVNEEINVSSSNESVATGFYDSLNSALSITGIGSGTATITVTTAQSNLTAICTVTVSEDMKENGITFSQNTSYEGMVKKVETEQLSYTLPEAVNWTPLNILQTGAFADCGSTGMFVLPIGGQAGGITSIEEGAFPADTSTFNVMLAADSSEIEEVLAGMNINVVSQNSTIVLEKGQATTVKLNAPTGLTTQWAVAGDEQTIALSAKEGSVVEITGISVGSASVTGTVTRGEENYSITYNIVVIDLSATDVPTETPMTSDVPILMPTDTNVPSQMPAESNIPSQVPTEGNVSSQEPTESNVPSIIPVESSVPGQVPEESKAPEGAPIQPSNVPAMPEIIPVISDEPLQTSTSSAITTTQPAATATQSTVTTTPPAETTVPVSENAFEKVDVSIKEAVVYAKGTKDSSKLVRIVGIVSEDMGKYTVTWKSENPKVAKVTVTGVGTAKIIAVKKGTTKITAQVTDGNNTKSYTIAVTVKNPSVKITGKKVVRTSQKIRLKAITYGLKGKVTWKVNKKKFAIISQKGLLKAKKTGKVKVTASCGKYKRTVMITIK